MKQMLIRCNYNVHINNLRHSPIDSAIDISIKLRFEQEYPTIITQCQRGMRDRLNN